MMTETDQTHEKPTFPRKMVVPLIAGAIAGVVSAGGVMIFMDAVMSEHITASRMIAASVGALYVLLAIGVGVGAASPALGAKYLNTEDAEEIRDQRTSLINSGVAMATWGAALIALASAAPLGPLSIELTLGFAIVAIGIGSWCAWQSYKASDELMAAVNLEASALSFALVFAALGGWAMAAHLEFSISPEPLDILTVFYVLSLLATFIAVGRRGMLKMV